MGASFAVHNDMKSHTGGVMILRLESGALIAMSTKEKLNTTSLTEAELVAVPFNMWAKYFFAEQGVGVDNYIMGKRNVLYQDITSLASNSLIMGKRLAANVPNSSTSGISLLPTE